MTLQQLKTLNRSTLALIVSGLAMAAGSFYCTVKRGDRVQANQVIAILESNDRLQTALLEAQERVSVAQAKLAQVRAGARSGEIAAQQAEISPLQAQLQGKMTTQAATVSRHQSEVNVARAEYDRSSACLQKAQ